MFQKEGVGKRRLVFLVASLLVTAPPSNLTRLYYNPGGGTPIHYLYGYVPPKGVVILKLLV